MARITAIALLLALSGMAHADMSEEDISKDVSVTDDAPFTAAELQSALESRLESSPGLPIHVSMAPDGAALVTVGDFRRGVSLRGAEHHQAARRVALAIVDLIEHQVRPEPVRPEPKQLPAPTKLAAVQAPASESIEVSASSGRTPRARPDLQLAAFARFRRDFGGAAALSYRGLYAASGLAGGDSLIHNEDAALLRWDTRVGWQIESPIPSLLVAVTAVVEAQHITYSDSLGREARWHTRVGAGAAASYEFLAGESWGLVASAGLDAFASRQTYRIDSDTVAATGYLDPWISLGVSIAPGGAQ
jgi:hypothetical protein